MIILKSASKMKELYVDFVRVLNDMNLNFKKSIIFF